MTEAVETKIPAKAQLDTIHLRLGATMRERDGWTVPESYGDPSWNMPQCVKQAAG